MVAETLFTRGAGAQSKSRLSSVVLPAPEGPEITTSFPEGDDPIPSKTVKSKNNRTQDDERSLILFYILNHFPDAFDGRLDLDHMPRDLDVVGLGTDRVRFSEHFLRQEFEFSA